MLVCLNNQIEGVGRFMLKTVEIKRGEEEEKRAASFFDGALAK